MTLQIQKALQLQAFLLLKEVWQVVGKQQLGNGRVSSTLVVHVLALIEWQHDRVVRIELLMLVLHAALALESVDEVAHGVVFDAVAISDFVQLYLVNEVGIKYVHACVIRVRCVTQARVVSASWLR